MSARGRGEKPTCIRVITVSAGPRWRQENKQRVRVRQSGRERKSGRESRQREGRDRLEGRNRKGLGGGESIRPQEAGGELGQGTPRQTESKSQGCGDLLRSPKSAPILRGKKEESRLANYFSAPALDNEHFGSSVKVRGRSRALFCQSITMRLIYHLTSIQIATICKTNLGESLEQLHSLPDQRQVGVLLPFSADPNTPKFHTYTQMHTNRDGHRQV